MEIKEMLIQIREKNGYKKKEVSEKTGIPYTTYIKYESGERKDVSMQALCKLADFYHVTTDYILGREDKDKKQNPLDLLNLITGEKELLEMYLAFPESERQNIIDKIIELGQAAKSGMMTEEESDEEIKTLFLTYFKDAASAGPGEPLSDNEPGKIEVIETDLSLAADCVIRVDGDSMEDQYSDGDLVLVKYQHEIPLGEIGIFRVDNCEGYIKEAGEYELISLNKKRPNISTKNKTVECIGLVLGKAKLPPKK